MTSTTPPLRGAAAAAAKRAAANARRQEMAVRKAAERAAAAALVIHWPLDAEKVTHPVKLDKIGAPIWSGTRCRIYAKPANKRMLLVDFQEFGHAKVWCKPELRSKFRPGDEIYAIRDGADWRLVGYYSNAGRRVG